MATEYEGPAGAGTPRDLAHRKVGTLPVNTRSLAHPEHPSTEEHPCACYESLVFVGHLVEDEADGEETEVVEAVVCTRCKLH